MIDYTPLKITLFSKKKSMAQLSRDIGISEDMVWRYTAGMSYPSLTLLDKMTDVLECDIDDIVRCVYEDSDEEKVKKYEEEVRTKYAAMDPEILEYLIPLLIEAYRRGLED